VTTRRCGAKLVPRRRDGARGGRWHRSKRTRPSCADGGTRRTKGTSTSSTMRRPRRPQPAVAGDGRGQRGCPQGERSTLGRLPRYRPHHEEMIAERDLSTRLRGGTFGRVPGIPPNNKVIEITGISIHRTPTASWWSTGRTPTSWLLAANGGDPDSSCTSATTESSVTRLAPPGWVVPGMACCRQALLEPTDDPAAPVSPAWTEQTRDELIRR
jgi:hypothetical protein